MASKRNTDRKTVRPQPRPSAAGNMSTSGRGAGTPPSSRRRLVLGSGLAIAAVAVVVGWSLVSNQSRSATPDAGRSTGTIVQANGGQWTNITPDTLASMLENEDFTLLNVKTPYIGEIAGTDLYIPYVDVAARAAELPADRAARIVVYCRSGHESAFAAQSLIDLGYTNIANLDGGMAAWTATGRQLVQRDRT